LNKFNSEALFYCQTRMPCWTCILKNGSNHRFIKWTISLAVAAFRFSWVRKWSLEEALEHIESIWLSHLRLVSINTPKTNTLAIISSSKINCGGGLTLAPTIISFVFVIIMFIRFSADQFNTLPKYVSIWLTPSLPIISDKVESSTNLCMRQPVDRSWSSISTMKVSGPSHDPWGMPPFNDSQSEKMLDNFTRWKRFCRKEQFLLSSISGTPSLHSFRITIEWSTWIKAFA